LILRKLYFVLFIKGLTNLKILVQRFQIGMGNTSAAVIGFVPENL